MTDTVRAIDDLRRRRRAAILAHSYQPEEIQAIADVVGDSLELSRAAASLDCETVVLCGVRFMAETAAVLAPDRTVLHPVPDAGCPLASCMDTNGLAALQKAHPEALTVVYVNSSIEAKAMSWACCTSANATAVVAAAPSGEVVFGPDRNLGAFIASRTGKRMWIFDGGCPPHHSMDLEDAARRRRLWPDAKLLVHPETPPAAWAMADAVLGTGAMIRFVRESSTSRFLIGTESGMVHRLRTLFPDREFESAGSIWCPDMKKISPVDVLSSLERMEPVIRIDPAVAEAARASVERMASIG